MSAAAPSPRVEQADIGGRARVLVVDDDEAVLHAARRVLASRYDVRATAAPIEAVALAERFRPDLAICDVRMPELDGFELLERLRTTCPDVDVILMTGSMTGQDEHLVRSLRERAFYFILKPFEREVLLALVDRCLETRRLRRAERRHLDRIERELATARAFQKAMLPSPRATVGGVLISARYRSCTELGGDLYDFAETADDELAFIIADVSGHGVPAALLTGAVKSAFRSNLGERTSPASIASALVRQLEEFSVDRFVTAFCGVLEPEQARLRYVNAGHPAGLLLDDLGAVRPLAASAPLLSPAFPPESWSDETTTLAPRGRLLLYTDGLIEMPGARESSYSEERLVEALRTAGPGETLLDALLRDVDGVRGAAAEDDITLLSLEWG